MAVCPAFDQRRSVSNACVRDGLGGDAVNGYNIFAIHVDRGQSMSVFLERDVIPGEKDHGQVIQRGNTEGLSPGIERP